MQGDIIGIYEEDGNCVAKYTYNAWGEATVEIVYSPLGYIAINNPFRYRGYYYDQETKDIIDGTSIGMQFEWELHNIVYGVTTVFGLENEQFKDVDLGRTMFEDKHGWKSYLMFGAYFCRNSLGWFIDLITNYN